MNSHDISLTPSSPSAAAQIVDTLLREEAIRFEFYRSAGPGGQNVNKVATAVRLRLDLAQATAIPESVRARLVRLAGHRLAGDRELVIEAQRLRAREQNRQDALERLAHLLEQALVPPRPRRPTRPSFGSRQRRLTDKRLRSQRKESRRGGGHGGGE